jgi:transcriptional antiterminator NusG
MSSTADAKWYVIQTRPNYEDKVSSSILTVSEYHGLEDYVLELKVLKKEVEEIKNGKKHLTSKRLYPNYIFAKLIPNNDLFRIIVGITGCSGFVGNPPSPLSKEDTKKFGIEMPPEVVVPYKLGDTVQIIDENFAGIPGVVKNLDLNKQTAGVSVSMFGRETIIELKLEDIVPIS